MAPKLTLYFSTEFPDETLAGLKLPITSEGNGLIFLGRGYEATIRVDNHWVSRKHLAFRFQPGLEGDGQWEVSDVGSTHGSWLNKKLMNPRDFYRLEHQDVLAIAKPSYLFTALFFPEDTLEILPPTEPQEDDAEQVETWPQVVAKMWDWFVNPRSLLGKVWRVVVAGIIVLVAVLFFH